MGEPDLADVAALLQEAAEQVISPRFRALQAGEVHEKSPGDLVTDADREAEVLIAAGLRRLDPAAEVVGEEAVAADASVLELVRTAERVWVVDPVDGTANFVAGSPDHAVMAALVVRGVTTAAVVWQPQHGALWTAERGSGAFRDGERLPARAPLPRDVGEVEGVIAATYLDAATRARVEAGGARFRRASPGQRCCGVTYPRVAAGAEDFALFWKVLPWDHAPGALLVTETGGAVRRWDGTDYAPAQGGTGLLVVSDADAWEDVRAGLLDA